MIKLYDTMARAKREFVPREADRVTMYVCGPTVYGRAHIGNARPAVVFDTLRRLLEHEFPDREIVYARNVTDVDDKIIAAAEAEGVEPSVITERFERFYLDDMGALGVAPPTIAPHATAEIGPMVKMIGELIAKGNAYAAEGHVLFSVPSDPDYGALSRRDRDAMVAGARVEIAPYKRDPADFILWKPSADGVIGWDSPWGRGRPGWHIECSAMIRAHLGETIDIHGGGLDLVFPHHENELAQSRCAHGGAPLANYWVHNGFVDMGAEKMSKSLGNVITPEHLLKSHKGETLRLALLSAHYRSPLPWTDSLVAQSKARLDRWYRALKIHLSCANEDRIRPNEINGFFEGGLNNDLDVPWALTSLDQFLRPSLPENVDREIALGDLEVAIGHAKFLGFLQENPDTWFQATMPRAIVGDRVFAIDSRPTPDVILAKIAERTAAKAARDFATSDRIRDELKAEGILLEDGPDGTTDWRRA